MRDGKIGIRTYFLTMSDKVRLSAFISENQYNAIVVLILANLNILQQCLLMIVSIFTNLHMLPNKTCFWIHCQIVSMYIVDIFDNIYIVEISQIDSFL